MLLPKEIIFRKFEEYEKNNGKAWLSVFQNINVQSAKRAKYLKLTTKAAISIDNVDKNRYRDISPYDSCRITLGTDGNYINASPLCIPETSQNYILCQGPLEETCADFWQMIWEKDVSVVVMLNKIIERGALKCYPYYPTKEEANLTFSSFQVVCDEETDEGDWTVRKLTLKNSQSGDDAKVVQHVQYTEWPDFGVPRCPTSFLHFMERYWELCDGSPSVVHCSAGVGRSGSFVLVDVVLKMIEQGITNVDIEELVVRMRESRMGLVQTHQQLRFSWSAVVEYLRRSNEPKCSEPSSVEKKVTSKRESVDEADTTAKRRETIARMVAMSRLAEHKRRETSWSGTACTAAAITAITAISLYYYFK